MKNSLVVHLEGDSKGLQNALDGAKKSIQNLGGDANKLKDIQDKFDKITSSTAPLNRRIRDIKKALEEMAVSGMDATEEGNEMWRKLSEAAQQYDEMLKRIQSDTRKVGDESSNVSPISSDGNGGGMMANVDFKGIGTDLLNKSGLGSLTPALGSIAGAINPVTLGLTAVGGTMIAAGKATAELETHLNSLQALTGLTDDEMKGIKDGAIEMSKGFKASAPEIVDAMKLIGSQAPELLKDSDSLMEVTKAANVLSEAAEIGVGDAAKAITGTMNQMGASASEATDIINTFAAASQQGAGDVSFLNDVFAKSGTVAKMAGLNYTELASLTEAAATKFDTGAEAGTAMQGVLLKLATSGKSEFMPSVVGMSKALENLANAELNEAQMKELVGEGGFKMLKTLIDNREQYDAYTKSLKGTNTAYEQMEINQKGIIGAINRMKSAWDSFLLVLGESGIMQGVVDNIVAVVDAVNDIINVVSDVIKSFEAFGQTGIENVNAFKIQLGWLIDVFKAVGTAVEVVVRLIAKAFNAIVDTVKMAKDGAIYHWNQVKKSLMEIGFVRALVNAFNKVIEGAVNMCNAIKKYWNKLKEFLGMKVDTNINEKVIKTDSNIKDNVVNNSVNTSSNTSPNTSPKSTSSKSSSTSSKTEKIDYLVSVDDNTLDTAEKKLSAWKSKLKTIKIDDVDGLQKCKDEIKKWQDEITKRKLIIEFGNEIYDNLNLFQSYLVELENAKREIEFEIDVNSVNAEEKINAIDGRLEALKSREIEIMDNGSIEELDAIRNEITDLIHQKYVISLAVETDTSKLNELNQEIESVKNDIIIEEIRLGIKPMIEDGSLNAIKKKIKEKEEEINLVLNTNINPESMKELQSELESLRKEEREKSIEIGVAKNVATISKNSDSWERGSIEDKKQSMSNAQSMVKEIQENYKLNLIGQDEAESQIADINSKLQELGLEPIELTFNEDGTLTTATENLERYKQQMQSVSDATSSMGNVFGSLGQAIGGTTGEMMSFAGQSINAIAQIIPQIVALIGAKEAEAMASGTASAASMPFPANIAAIASIVATLVGVFASLPKFESGGIVGGSSFTGDKLLARVNSGEGVLTRKGVQNLQNLYDSAGFSQNQSNTLRGDVNFTITGSSLKGVLKNYDSKMSRIK